MAGRKKKATDYSEVLASCDRGDQMAERPNRRHIKVQGFSGSGKTTFALSFLARHAKGLKPEQVLMTIVDNDLEGQASLIKREDIVPKDLRSRIYRKVCRTPDEVNEIILAFIDLHRKHKEEHPNGLRIMLFENEGAYYEACRDHYSIEVHGKTEAELLLSRQRQAISEGKKTLPAFAEGQMHSYKVINKVFFTPYERLKIGAEMFDYHFISTVLLREYTENYGTPQEKTVIVAQGRRDKTDPLFEWIIQLSKQERTKGGKLQTKYTWTIKKSRSVQAFQMNKPDQEKFWSEIEKMEGQA